MAKAKKKKAEPQGVTVSIGPVDVWLELDVLREIITDNLYGSVGDAVEDYAKTAEGKKRLAAIVHTIMTEETLTKSIQDRIVRMVLK